MWMQLGVFGGAMGNQITFSTLERVDVDATRSLRKYVNEYPDLSVPSNGSMWMQPPSPPQRGQGVHSFSTLERVDVDATCEPVERDMHGCPSFSTLERVDVDATSRYPPR